MSRYDITASASNSYERHFAYIWLRTQAASVTAKSATCVKIHMHRLQGGQQHESPDTLSEDRK